MICGVDVENAAVLYYSIVSNGMKELGLDLKCSSCRYLLVGIFGM